MGLLLQAVVKLHRTCIALINSVILQAEKLIFIASMARLERRNKGATGKCCFVDDYEEADIQAMMEADMAEELGPQAPTNKEKNENIVIID